jgi:sRNA-binding carbon storage regulator CsrA
MLSLGVSVGSRIKIGDNTVKVTSIEDPNIVGLQLDGGKVVYVSDVETVEVFPDVFIQSGRRERKLDKSTRIGIEAPKAIRIERVR